MPHELARVMGEVRALDAQQAELQAAADAALVDKLQKAGKQVRRRQVSRPRFCVQASLQPFQFAYSGDARESVSCFR